MGEPDETTYLTGLRKKNTQELFGFLVRQIRRQRIDKMANHVITESDAISSLSAAAPPGLTSPANAQLFLRSYKMHLIK